MRTDPTRELDLDVEMAAQAHQMLLADLDEALAAGVLDVAAPTQLPGWTVGHLLAHLAQHAESHVGLFDAATAGETGEQYPRGGDGRAEAIEAASPRPADVQVDHVRRAVWSLEGRWASSDWQGSALLRVGATVPLTELPFRRSREVLLHRIDLGLGATFDELPSRYLRKELSRLEMLWKARQPMGMTSLPAAANAAPPPQRLAWLTGRGEITGLGPSNVF